MAAQPDADLVTVCTDVTDGGTLVRVVAPSRQIRMVDLMPVFEALDLNLVSYMAEKDPDAVGGALQAPLGRRKHSFRGRFLVTDAEGHNLSEDMLDELVVALQEALHVRLSRLGRCNALQEQSRRGSVASYATDASIDPDSPSFHIASAGAAVGLHAQSSAPSLGQLSHAHSNLQPGPNYHPGCPAQHAHSQPQSHQHQHGVQHLNPDSQHLQQPQYSLPQYPDHAPSISSMLLSEHSISSVGSLIRAPSGAASDPPTVPSPPSNTRFDNTTFTFLQQQGDPVFLDATSQIPVTSSTTAAGVGGGMLYDERYSGGVLATPFTTATVQPYSHSHHHHHTRSQPPLQPQFQPQDMYELALVFPQRASSASSTPLNLSGTLPSIATPSPLPDGAGALAPPPALTAPVPGRAHVSFLEPAPCTVTTASAAAASLSSRPPSGGLLVVPASSPLPLASISSSAAMSVDAAVGAVVPSSVRASGDGSPASSSEEERDGSYTWWSTFTAQDTVARIMSHPARSISAEADLGQAKSLMTKYNISALLVNTGNASPGFITKRDFLKVQFSKNFKRTKVKDVMTQPVIFVDINLPIEQCSHVLESHGVRRVLVRDPSRVSVDDPLSAFVGVVSDADLFKCMGAPAMSPVMSSIANSSEQAQPYFGMLPGSDNCLPPLPSPPSLRQPVVQSPEPPRSQPQVQTQQQTQAPLALSVTSSASVSVSNSTGPSHTASISAGLPLTADAANAAALALASSTASVVTMRLNTEASLADRYRCAAALWELDFNEIEVTRRIGEGSFGEVLLANFRGTKVAVKRLRGFDVGPDNPDTGAPGEAGPSPTQMPIFRQFFEREIEILATIRHPNVVNFIGTCHTPPNVCLVTEYCARGSLDHLLHKSSIPLDLTKKVEFSMDIARGMSCLHSQKPPIIHRDLKTANLLVSARFEVKVADFGLSRIKDHAQLINSRAGLEGTVEYAAPEVLRGEPYTEKCDIWSYAVLLWEIIHRQRPYADADVPIYILMMSLGNGTLRLPPVREELATCGLVRLVERCMAWHPADRPSFREVLHALEAEYKILRGKAAAVPRSDSASSMVVLPGGQARGPGADGAAPHDAHHPHGAATGPASSAMAARPSPQALTPPQQQRRAIGAEAAPQKKSSKLGLGAGLYTPGPEVDYSRGGAEPSVANIRSQAQVLAQGSSGVGSHGSYQSPHPTPHTHTQLPSQHPQQGARVRVKLAVPAQATAALHGSVTVGGAGGNNHDTPDPVSPADSSSRIPSSRNASTSTAGRGAGAPGKPNSAGRTNGRSLRSAARSKSMPLPEFEWFGGEEGSDEYMDTTDSVADDEADAGASAGTSTSGATSGAAAPAAQVHAHHPLSLLSSDRGGVRSTPYPESIVLRHETSVDDNQRDVFSATVDGATSEFVDDPTAQHLPQNLIRVMRQDQVGAASAMVTTSRSVNSKEVAEQKRQQLNERVEMSAQPEWAGRVEDVLVSPVVAAVVRQSPFHLASSSPFADAADTPWSPRRSEDAGSSPSCFCSHPISEYAATSLVQCQQQQQQQQHPASVPCDQPVASTTWAPPRQTALISPFAQLAKEAPLSATHEEEEEEEDRPCTEASERRNETEEQCWRLTVSGGGGAAAAHTANSTDVITKTEKDQQTFVEACWGAMGTRSKPPSGNVYPPSAAPIGRLSPTTANTQGMPTLASPHIQHGDDAGAVDDGAVVHRRVEAGNEEVIVVVEDGEEDDRSEREQQLVATLSSASAGLEALSLALPAVMAFSGTGLAGVRSGSDQFDDDEDEDATLHTTAWVRL
ncbi:hypothetical protein Vretimale_5660 [Volvox reticuliferus]|uniref:Protein kinase domain-containing protein n=1 Tax=Volvox reticuliferus TaxID=1737510 RepID=A0A8J4FLS5_9CHLO|nr:hypothetical protein Vretifemale_5638 [Volvox reticuliferus]GIM00708.1 hypothetical protein Vretimale_5660 [Volvox reticuliferus]